ncbi:MAG: hypothetical protein JRN35_05815 [Nitrososphaerota archaeon]|nr:hypothetical protein [Nitrososphaerota archaeon]
MTADQMREVGQYAGFLRTEPERMEDGRTCLAVLYIPFFDESAFSNFVEWIGKVSPLVSKSDKGGGADKVKP